MTDTDRRTEPALTPEQWQFCREMIQGNAEEPLTEEERISAVAKHAVYLLEGGMPYDATALHGAMAVLNEGLGAFTWDDVALLNGLTRREMEGWESSRLDALADRIAALLPPR